MLPSNTPTIVTRLRLAIFDCDGTLVDSQHTIVGAMQHAFHANGLDAPPREAILRVVGLPLHQCIRLLYAQGDQATIDRIEDAYRETYRITREAGDQEPPLYPGTRELLERLHAQGILLAVATGKSRRGLTHTLAAQGLTELFVDTRTADDGPGKPNPDILLDLMDVWQIPAHETCMIGDTTFDVEMGRHAKMKSFGVTWGYHTPEMLHDAGATAIVDSWGELYASLNAHYVLHENEATAE